MLENIVYFDSAAIYLLTGIFSYLGRRKPLKSEKNEVCVNSARSLPPVKSKIGFIALDMRKVNLLIYRLLCW